MPYRSGPTIINPMKRLLYTHCLLILLFSASLYGQTDLGYFSGLSYTDVVLKGDAAWDHLSQINSLTGVEVTTPLEGKDKVSRKIRYAMNLPVYARISQLDDRIRQPLEENRALTLGAHFFIGAELDGPFDRGPFVSALHTGPLLDFQYFSDSFVALLGWEWGGNLSLFLGDRFFTGMGASIRYHFWGIHTVGNSLRYDLYVENGWGVALYPVIGFRY